MQVVWVLPAPRVGQRHDRNSENSDLGAVAHHVFGIEVTCGCRGSCRRCHKYSRCLCRVARALGRYWVTMSGTTDIMHSLFLLRFTLIQGTCGSHNWCHILYVSVIVSRFYALSRSQSTITRDITNSTSMWHPAFIAATHLATTIGATYVVHSLFGECLIVARKLMHCFSHV